MDLVDGIVGLAVLVGLVGIVVPVLPGSLLIGVAVLLWALDAGTVGGWVVAAVVVALLVAGNAATYVITGTRVAASGAPRRTLVLAGLAGVVGFFVIPVLGLFLFFAGGLFAAEYWRLRDVPAARSSAWVALRATALGLLVELTLAFAAAATWFVSAANGVGG
ncbi:DUF456 domain-containing protein [Cellulomonas carbonis]|uniref:Membrane protein n=1 Tax=Cellulomonas carbonis T26 TaxID=947969 RepID=A0A0A0BZI1_9CELL|nr:DUF456 domain-containing protein [Cellulomonas carbonis]KGM12589.1 membrane protein [Cellulomonas carbonis T26]GGB93219.1 hypothetical protein GCM10010972_02350 [Cellulomonas carbonis]